MDEPFFDLNVQLSSLQFSDPSRQQRVDIRDLFAAGYLYPIKLGTEAGPEAGNDNRRWLIEYADKFNHHLYFARSNWIAVDKSIVVPGSFRRGQRFILDSKATWGKGHDTVLGYVGFRHREEGVGRIWQGAIHFPLKGDDPGEVNFKDNRYIARECSEWMADAGRGSDLAFLGGDFNTNDLRNDFDQGVGNYTSMGDELRRHPNTGHGPIEGLCSYDRDGRVEAKKIKVLDDKEFFQFGDHYVYRGTWRIRKMQRRNA